MAIAMFFITAAIVGAFVIVNLHDAETEVREFAEPTVDQLSRVESLIKLDSFIANKRGSTIRMTIFSSSGDVINDTSGVEHVKESTIFFDEQISSILEDDIGAIREKYNSPYDDTYTMFTYYVKVQVSDKVDPNSFLIIRFSKTAVVGSQTFYIFVGSLLAFWIVIAIVLVVLFKMNIKATMEPLTAVQNILTDIKQGQYKRSKSNKILVASEADKMVDQIDQLGAVINDTMHNLNVLLESITQGIIALDKDGEIILANTNAVNMFKLDPKTGPSKEFVKQYAQEYAMFKKSLRTHKETTFENVVDGRYLHVQTIFPPKEEGLDMYMLLVITDMTEQYKTAKAKQEFFANASHELKTPLTAISGYSEILSMQKPTEKQVEKCSNEIQTNTNRMKALIEEMLQLSKMDAQTSGIEKEEFSIKTLCDETIDELRVIAKNHNVSIETKGDATINGNYKEMMMLVKNLVSNAIKYNKDGGYVKINISDDENNAILCVEDNGIGIAKENQDKIFERFFRVDKARANNNKDESSTGLGLSIVKQVVDDHRGTIEVESDLGKGTKFIVTIPKR